MTGYILKAYNYNTDGSRDNMQDDSIVGLYWKRDETAIRETGKKYGNYLLKISYNILFDLEDSKESVNSI